MKDFVVQCRDSGEFVFYWEKVVLQRMYSIYRSQEPHSKPRDYLHCGLRNGISSPGRSCYRSRRQFVFVARSALEPHPVFQRRDDSGSSGYSINPASEATISLTIVVSKELHLSRSRMRDGEDTEVESVGPR